MKKGTWQHGIYGYQHHGCRCEICIEKMRAFRAKYRPPKSDNQNIRLSARVFVDRLERDGRLTAIPTSKIHRWLKYDMDIYAADRQACKLGYHPYEIWGDAFYQGVSTTSS